MTTRSKQWYIKTSRLWNSFANNSIGRLPDPASATRSSVKRPMESTALPLGRREREERDSKGKETVGVVPFGLRPRKLRESERCVAPATLRAEEAERLVLSAVLS